MLLITWFCHAAEIAAWGMFSDFFIPKPKSCWKHIAEFDSMFLVGESIASEKHAALTADQSVQTGKKVNWKVKENGRLFYLNKSFLHIYLCSLNSKLTVTAARRNSLSLLLDCESATMQDTINIYPGWRKQWLFEWTWCEHPFEHQVSGEHYVAGSRGVQAKNPAHGWPLVVTTRDCKASCGLDLNCSVSKMCQTPLPLHPPPNICQNTVITND